MSFIHRDPIYLLSEHRNKGLWNTGKGTFIGKYLFTYFTHINVSGIDIILIFGPVSLISKRCS